MKLMSYKLSNMYIITTDSKKVARINGNAFWDNLGEIISAFCDPKSKIEYTKKHGLSDFKSLGVFESKIDLKDQFAEYLI